MKRLEVSVIQGALTKIFVEKLNVFSKPEILFILTVASIFTHFIITGALVIGVITYALTNREIRTKMFRAKGLLSLAAISGLAIVIPIIYGRWISVIAGVGVIIVLLFYLYAQSIMTTQLYEFSIDVACFMSTICFLVAAGQKIYYGYSYRSTAGLLNANYYGTIIEFVVLFCVYRIITGKEKPMYYIGLIAINILGLFLCDCQSAWIAIIAGVFILICFNKYKKHALIFLAISTVLVCIGILVPGILPRWNCMPSTVATRINIWKTALLGIKAYPFFGQGTLTYFHINELYDGYKTYHAHSLYLDPLLSYGIVGVAIMGTYLYTYFKELKKQPREIQTLIYAFVATVCVHGLTDITILWLQTGMLLLFVASACFMKNNFQQIVDTGNN